ncbi:MAG: serine/threonine-protein phosphatase [Anaerolineae bacterium]|nr:serine/threonine-protein phosphatase [Anaerolineae bacterium]MDW8172122.1 hypothetical protein [Anaerolineae bacterium]
MPFELEALIGHIYLANGKPIKTTPPGALCEVAPRKAARGREADTFFALVVPSGPHAPVTFYEQMALMAAERYFSTSGSVTSALRDVLNTLNNNLFEHNASGRRPYEASLICAVLRDQDLYLARVGACAALLRHNASTQCLPDDIHDDEALFLPPLGVRPIPEVQMRRLSVDAGSRLILADSAIAEAPKDKLEQLFAAPTLGEVIDDLRLLLVGSAQALVAEFVLPEAPVPMPVVEGESSKAISAELAAKDRSTTQPTAPVTATAAASPPARKPRRNPISALRRAILSGLAGIVGGLFNAIGGLMGKLFARPVDQPRVRYSAAFLTTVVFLLPLLVVGGVIVSWAVGIGETRFEECVRQALSAAQLARSIDSANPQGVLQTWEATLLKVDECDALRPGDLTLASLRREGLEVSDRLNNIQRRQALLLTSLPGATISRLVLQGLDLYAFDSANRLAYRLTLGSDGLSLASNQPLVNMRRGATVDGLTVGEVIGIAYDDQFNSIVALDTSGVLVRCPPRFIMECDAQRVLGAETWRTPISLSIWQGNLYVLDIGANQLWRYQPAGGSYSSGPQEYFNRDIRPNLASAVDFAISTAGNTRGSVYILYREGIISRHFGGEQQPFSFAGFPDALALNLATVDSFYLNDSPIDTAFYITSRKTRTLYETSIAGSFIASYRITDESLFELLSDITADPARGILYVASGNSIFSVRKGG